MLDQPSVRTDGALRPGAEGQPLLVLGRRVSSHRKTFLSGPSWVSERTRSRRAGSGELLAERSCLHRWCGLRPAPGEAGCPSKGSVGGAGRASGVFSETTPLPEPQCLHLEVDESRAPTALCLPPHLQPPLVGRASQSQKRRTLDTEAVDKPGGGR